MDIGTVEPIAGAGFVMSLAYLALDRFRYRNEVEQGAHVALATFEPDGDGEADPPDSIANSDQMRELKWLARQNCNGFWPQSPVAWIYAIVFRQELDVKLTAALGALSALALATGVATRISIWSFMGWVNAPGWLEFDFYICLAAITFPPICVSVGRLLMTWCQTRARHLEGQLNDILKDLAAKAQAPPIPQDGDAAPA